MIDVMNNMPSPAICEKHGIKGIGRNSAKNTGMRKIMRTLEIKGNRLALMKNMETGWWIEKGYKALDRIKAS